MTGLKPDRDILQQPHLACVTPGSAKKFAWLGLGFDPWAVCKSDPYPRTFLAPYTSYIFLCPGYFSITPQGMTDTCPMVADNRFLGSESDFYLDSQLYQIFLQLYKLYLRGQELRRPGLDWNECILNLTPRESVLSPQNVALWTFCEISPWL